MVPVAFLFCVAVPFGLLVVLYNGIFKDRKAKNLAYRERKAKAEAIKQAKLGLQEKRKSHG